MYFLVCIHQMSSVQQSSRLGPQGLHFHDMYEQTHKAPVQGCIGLVNIYTHKPSGLQYHVKIINGSDNERAKKKCLREIKIYNLTKLVDHVILVDIFEEHDTCYLVLDIINDGDLLSRECLGESNISKTIENLAKSLVDISRVSPGHLKPLKSKTSSPLKRLKNIFKR